MNREPIKNICVLFFGIMFSGSIASAAVTFDWAVIGNAGNEKDEQTGYGAVADEYSISKTEVTTAQYVEFLNAVAATDTYGLYDTNMGGSTWYSGISRSGSSGSWEYSANAGWEKKPVVYVTWYDTLRFTNWLHNGQQGAGTTEYGAYNMAQGASVVRLDGADYWLPSEDEWYKAAYYSQSGTYYDYATGTDIVPSRTTPAGDTGNSANYYDGNTYLGLTDVGAYDESESPYGTYDQNGNVWEWNEALIDSNRGLRGGSWSDQPYLPASYRSYGDPAFGYYYVGFRVASSFTGNEGGAVPEPASVGLVLLSVGGLVLRRAKRA